MSGLLLVWLSQKDVCSVEQFWAESVDLLCESCKNDKTLMQLPNLYDRELNWLKKERKKERKKEEKARLSL